MLIFPTKFVFVHAPSTAGTWFRYIVRNHVHPDRVLPYLDTHARASLIPDEYKDLPIYAMVREPFDWYRSFARRNTSFDMGPTDQTPYYWNFPQVLDRPFNILWFEKGIRGQWMKVLTKFGLLNRKVDNALINTEPINVTRSVLPEWWNEDEVRALIYKDKELVESYGYSC